MVQGVVEKGREEIPLNQQKNITQLARANYYNGKA